MSSKLKKKANRKTEKNANTAETFDFSDGFSDFSKKLVCITYPGKINNTDKMLDTLGGIKVIEHIVAHQKKNLELRFRPDDFYSKPCISDRSTKPNILLKIKIRKPMINSDSETTEVPCKAEIVSFEVMGLSAVTFSFNKLCDFQYLPLTTKSNVETSQSNLEYIHDIIVPKNLPDLKWFEDEATQNLPLFLAPAYFSKSDVTASTLHFDRSHFYEGRFRADYADRFRNQEIKRKMARTKQDTSKLRTVMLLRFDDDIPKEPNQTILNNFQSRVNVINGLGVALTKLKKFFNDRPIASKNCLNYYMQFNAEHFKILLPCVAFYYLSGPWRMMWIRYGYDPRIDGASRIYQSLDFRIRGVVGLKRFITTKRKYRRKNQTFVTSPHHDAEPQPSTSAQSLLEAFNESSLQNSQADKNLYTEEAFMLRPGLIPSARQLMYQYHDVQLPDIQAMLSRLPNILPGVCCDPKNGWLPPGFHDQCREIITKYIDGEIIRALDKQRALEAASAPEITPDIVEEEAEGMGQKSEGILHEISSDDSSSSEDLSDDDERGDGVGVDEDLLEEIDKLLSNN